MRIQRDIPAQLICSGVKKSNLRQLVEKVMETENIKPREIRSREVGIAINTYKKELKLQNCQTIIRKYNASQGIEYFISYEDLDDDVILGFIRLRIPGNPFRTEITKNTGIIRELHIYGSEVGIGLFPNMVQAQHKGIGKMLLEKAEDIAKENGMKDMIVIAGTGVKPYYYKFGYVPKGPYVHKELQA